MTTKHSVVQEQKIVLDEIYRVVFDQRIFEEDKTDYIRRLLYDKYREWQADSARVETLGQNVH